MSIRAINWARDVGKSIGIPSRHRLALLTLAAHHHDKTGSCFPSYDTIADEVGCNRRKAMELVSDLEANGVIIRQSRRRGQRQGSNQYVLFGRPASERWAVVRVHPSAPSEDFSGCKKKHPEDEFLRVHPSAPDRDWYTTPSDAPLADVVAFPVQKVSNGGHS